MAKVVIVFISWIFLMTCSAYRSYSYSPHDSFPSQSSESEEYDYYRPTPRPISRIDQTSREYQSQKPTYSHRTTPTSIYHHEETILEDSNLNLHARSNERTTLRSTMLNHEDIVNENVNKNVYQRAERPNIQRSVPDSEVRRIQDEERTRLGDGRVKSSVDRSVNGTVKIVNNPKVNSRRGALTSESVTERVHNIINNSISVIMKFVTNGRPTRRITTNTTTIPVNGDKPDNATANPIDDQESGASKLPGQHNQRGSSSDNVVFPGQISVSGRVGGGFAPSITDVPEECLKMGICENVKNYPYEHVDKLVERLGEQRYKYMIDETELPEIAQRIGPNEETEMCQFTQKVIIPQAAPDKTGKWFYILNTKENPLQGFNVEICKQDKSPCTSFATFLGGYEAFCKQKYVLRYLTSIDENTGETVERSFKMPSCCSCVLRHAE